MEAIFRKVPINKVSKAGVYLTNLGELEYSGNVYVPNNAIMATAVFERSGFWSIPQQGNHRALQFPHYYFEPIELPSDEEKQAILMEWYNAQQFQSNYPAEPSSFMAGFNKAIELIKGGK